MFDDYLVVAAGEGSRWARRRRIDLAELVDEPWILAPLDAWNTRIIAEAFASKGLKMPRISVITYSMHLRTNLLANGDCITTFPNSVLRLNADWFSLKVLSLELPARSWPVLAVTLRNRTLSPIVQRFLEHVREQAKSIAARDLIPSSRTKEDKP